MKKIREDQPHPPDATSPFMLTLFFFQIDVEVSTHSAQRSHINI